MRYILDANGYVTSVYWGCYGNDCTEYTGEVPSGYTDLNDWSTNTLINAYYIDENGNLVLDAERLKELEEKAGQQAVDNAPILHKDFYGTSEILDSQYQSATATGKILTLENVKRINPKVKLTNVDCYADSQVDIVTQGKNMLRNDAITETIAGVTFTKNIDGSIRINGTATKEIEYNLSGSGTNATSIFVLKKGLDYYLNLGGLSCEMRFYDGTTSQVYVGTDGIINLPEDKKVTQVLIKIPSGTEVNNVIYPMLEYGTSASEYESYKARVFTIDLSEYITPEVLYPADDLYPSDDLYPLGTGIDYIYIENGKVSVSVNGSLRYSNGNVNLFDGFNIVYTLQDTNIEMTYSVNVLEVEDLSFLQGKITPSGMFGVLNDGSIKTVNGEFCIYGRDGELDMKLDRDGQWFYDGQTPIGKMGTAYMGGVIYALAFFIRKIKQADFLFYDDDLNGYVQSISITKDGVITRGGYGDTKVVWGQGIEYLSIIPVTSSARALKIQGSDGMAYTVNISASDGRLKKNIQESETNALNVLNQIKFRQFDWKGNDAHQKLGYIAQELEDIEEDLIVKVPQTDNDNNVIDYLYQINNNNFIAYLTKAVTELSQKVEEQQEQINFLIRELGFKREKPKAERKPKEEIKQYDNEEIKKEIPKVKNRPVFKYKNGKAERDGNNE